MASPKISSRQQAQLAYLQTLPPKFQRFHTIVEQMATLQAEESVVRGFTRNLEELKANAQALSLTGLAETAGQMATMSRRSGGHQTKVRGLREFLGSLKIKYEGALRQATTPEQRSGEAAPTEH
jgi:hypothetical protein